MKAFRVHRNNEEYFRVDLPKHLFPDGKCRSTMGKTRREALERADQIVQNRK